MCEQLQLTGCLLLVCAVGKWEAGKKFDSIVRGLVACAFPLGCERLHKGGSRRRRMRAFTGTVVVQSHSFRMGRHTVLARSVPSQFGGVDDVAHITVKSHFL